MSRLVRKGLPLPARRSCWKRSQRLDLNAFLDSIALDCRCRRDRCFIPAEEGRRADTPQALRRMMTNLIDNGLKSLSGRYWLSCQQWRPIIQDG
jgi:signal transduction histidine kinase